MLNGVGAFSGAEILILICLTGLCIFAPILAKSKHMEAGIWNPMLCFSMTFAYYVIVSPVMAAINGLTFLRGVEHRPFFIVGWEFGLISFLAVLTGYLLFKEEYRSLPGTSEAFDGEEIKKKVVNLLYVVIFFQVILFGPLFFLKANFLSGEVMEQQLEGPLYFYLYHPINFLIFISACLFLLYLRGQYKNLFIVIALFSVSLFITEAFRYRLVLLVMSLMFVYHLYSKKSFDFKLIFSLAIPFIFLMGAMEIARSYGKGIDMQKLETSDNEEVFLSSFEEGAGVFSATSFALSEYDSHFPRTNLDFLINAVAMPVPRKIWPGKPNAEYLFYPNSLYSYHTNIEGMGTGQAFLYYFEYFQSYGLFGVILFSFLLGLGMAKAWNYYAMKPDSPLHLVFIAVFSSFVYVIVSRGYLAQQLTTFMFTIGPILFLIRQSKNKLSQKKFFTDHQDVHEYH